MLLRNEGEGFFSFWKIFQKRAEQELTRFGISRQSWFELSSEKGLSVKCFQPFCIKWTEIQPNQIPQIWEKKIPSQTQEKQAKFHPDRNVFAKAIKAEVKVMMLYLAFIRLFHPKSSSSTLHAAGWIPQSWVRCCSCTFWLKYREFERAGLKIPSRSTHGSLSMSHGGNSMS